MKGKDKSTQPGRGRLRASGGQVTPVLVALKGGNLIFEQREALKGPEPGNRGAILAF